MAYGMQKLIAAGHGYEDIMNYTLDQFDCFLEQSDLLEKQKLQTFIATSALASRGEPSEVDKVIKRLDN